MSIEVLGHFKPTQMLGKSIAVLNLPDFYRIYSPDSGAGDAKCLSFSLLLYYTSIHFQSSYGSYLYYAHDMEFVKTKGKYKN